LLSVHQHHSTDVFIATEIWDNQNPPMADAIVTSIAGIACSALAADCAPVLFADPVARVIGAAHAGWRGALDSITDNTILAMVSLGAKPENMIATIGPCISQKHFEVGPEFVDDFLGERADNQSLFTQGHNDRTYFDIKTYLVKKLLRAGLKTVSALPACSYAQNADYFSYRYNTHRGITDYGRNISAIMLKNE
ncbi:MAG: peptidoglycan editing factor PgeF, partial [Robiginitomaculum sp.]|nr:peptidoglycan editing factor PgeF [Robiginitomaculum sp.]